jgi:hypothetical protein
MIFLQFAGSILFGIFVAGILLLVHLERCDTLYLLTAMSEDEWRHAAWIKEEVFLLRNRELDVYTVHAGLAELEKLGFILGRWPPFLPASLHDDETREYRLNEDGPTLPAAAFWGRLVSVRLPAR